MGDGHGGGPLRGGTLGVVSEESRESAPETKSTLCTPYVGRLDSKLYLTNKYNKKKENVQDSILLTSELCRVCIVTVKEPALHRDLLSDDWVSVLVRTPICLDCRILKLTFGLL